MKKSIEAFNRSPWYLQVIIGLVGLAVVVALAIPLSWLVEILWGYVFCNWLRLSSSGSHLGCQLVSSSHGRQSLMLFLRLWNACL